MRWFLWLVVLVVVVAGIYGYKNNSAGCAKLATDLHSDAPVIAADLITIFTPTTAPVPATAADGTSATSVASTSGTAPASTAAAFAAPSAPTVPPGPAALPPLPANSLIQNGDFSQGSAHWEGDGQAVAKGLMVTLNPSSWTRIYQTFATGSQRLYSIVVYYRLSPDISLSKNPADYTAINKLIQISGFENFGSFNSSPGQFYGTVGDPNSDGVSLEVYAPRLGSSDVQTYQHSYPAVPVSESKIFGLAYPPGSGSVVILGAAVTGN